MFGLDTVFLLGVWVITGAAAAAANNNENNNNRNNWQETIHTTYQAPSYSASSSSSSISSSVSSSVHTNHNYFEKRTIWDWWCNGLESEERQVLLDVGFNDRSGCFSLKELKENIAFCEWAEREWPYTFSKVNGCFSSFLEFKGNFFADFKKANLPGEGDNWVRLKGDQGWKNTEDNTIWKKDKKHGDHWDVSDRKGNKVKEVDFNGRQIWPDGPKNKNKR